MLDDSQLANWQAMYAAQLFQGWAVWLSKLPRLDSKVEVKMAGNSVDFLLKIPAAGEAQPASFLNSLGTFSKT